MKKLKQFLFFTFLINWGMIGIYTLAGGTWDKWYATVVAVGYMFIPMAVVFVIERRSGNTAIKKGLGISFRVNKWFVVGWLLPPVIAFLTLGINLLFPSVSYSPDMEGMIERLGEQFSSEKLELARAQIESMPFHPVWLGLIQGLIAGATINAIAGFGEELGWRGFMVKELSGLSFWRASLIIGFIWGIWHAPIIALGHNYPQHPYWGILMMTIWCILLTPLFLYVRIKSGSVIAAAIMHGTINATFGLAVMVIVGGNDLTTGVTGLPGFITLVIINILFVVYDRFFDKQHIMNKKIETNLWH